MRKKHSGLAAGGQIALQRILLILVAILLSTIFLALSGYDQWAIVKGLVQSFTVDIAGTVRWATPMILSGLAICVCYKANVFNLGVDGQLFMGAAAASAVALVMPATTNQFVSLLLIFAAAVLAGVLFALIPALLKIYMNVNEVVSTLLLNFVGEYFVNYLVNGPMRDPTSGTNLNASAVFSKNCWLPHLSIFEPSSANVGVFIAVILAAVMVFLFARTTMGHEIRLVGTNAEFARYSGIRPKRVILRVMSISGAIAGVIGAIEVTAVQHRLIAGFNPDLGFEGIVVSLLANNDPVGVIFSGAFFGALKNGSTNMERLTGIPSSVSRIVEAIIILVISANFTIRLIKKRKSNVSKEGVKDEH